MDIGVVVEEDFYNRLPRDVDPSHPHVVDLASDNDSVATMEETRDLVYHHCEHNPGPSTSGREKSTRPSTEIAQGGSSRIVVGFGQN